MSWWDDITSWLHKSTSGVGAGARSTAQGKTNMMGNMLGQTTPPLAGSGFDPAPLINKADQMYQNLLKKQTAQGPQPGTLEYTLQQLIAGQNAGMPQMLSPEQIRSQAAKQAGLQYDPQIAAIKAEMDRSKNQAGKNQKQLGTIYSDLAGSYKGDVSTSAANTKAAKKAESAALKELQGTVSGNYSGQIDAQTKELKNLGVADALPSTTANQKADLQFLNKLNSTESGAQQRAIDLQGLGDKSYYAQGSGIAKTEGAESITNLTQQLTDYLNQQGTQMSSIKGQEQSAMQQLISQMSSGQNDAYSKWDQARWNRTLNIAQLQQQIEKAKNAGNTPTKGMSGALAYLQKALPDPSRDVSAINNIMQSQPTVDNKRKAADGTTVGQNPYSMAAQARDYAAKNGLSAQETDALVMSIYTFYGLG